MEQYVFAEVIDEPTSEIAVSYKQAIIKDNLAAIDAYVDKQLEPYIDAVIDPNDEQQIKDARKCMADLNKLKAPIDNERRRIKREYEAPLKAFEDRVKVITGKIDSARSAIKVQVDRADDDFRLQRREMLLDEYAAIAGPIADLIPLDSLIDSEIMRRSTSAESACKKLSDKVVKAMDGYNTLQAKDMPHKDEIIARYCETLDIGAALKYGDELAEADRRLAEVKAAMEQVEATKSKRQDDRQKAPICSWRLILEFEGTREFAQRVARAIKSVGLTGDIKNLGRIDAN